MRFALTIENGFEVRQWPSQPPVPVFINWSAALERAIGRPGRRRRRSAQAEHVDSRVDLWHDRVAEAHAAASRDGLAPPRS